MDTRGLVADAARGCREVFEERFRRYGASWRFLRLSALGDRVFTKAARIRRLDALGGTGRVGDTIESEYTGIVNYSVLMADRLAHEGLAVPDLSTPVAARWADPEHALTTYDGVMNQAMELMDRKNHDYGDAWRHLLPSTFADEIITRTLRLRELTQEGESAVGAVGDQIVDTLNYALLAVVRRRIDGC